jgi:crotonobetainyl-CoA:carnitine CoA-transferase CaiB-like acyl-CoA transferase
MTKVMQGVRVLEVAQFTFVPAAGAVLTDWGADVIKIEHPVRGDAQRGIKELQRLAVNPQRSALMQHPNRGKRSVGIDISTPEGQELLYEIAKTCDVFLTNYLPSARQKLAIDVDHIRAANPNIIYVRGSAFGEKGPERDKGGFDSTAYWARGGSSVLVTPRELEGPLTQPGPAYGDTIGGMNIAGGIAAALFHRERTGEATEVDVSLLSSGIWATACSIDVCMELKVNPFANAMPGQDVVGTNPFMGVFKTSDGGFINLTVLSPSQLIEDTFTHLGDREAVGEFARSLPGSEEGDGRAAVCLLARKAQDDEGTVGRLSVARRYRERRTGPGQRFHLRSRKRRWRRADQTGRQSGAV